MIVRRPLYQTLSSITDDLMSATATTQLQTSSVELTLPIDLRLPGENDDLIGDLPLFRMRTAFDPEPAHIHIVLNMVAL